MPTGTNPFDHSRSCSAGGGIGGDRRMWKDLDYEDIGRFMMDGRSE